MNPKLTEQEWAQIVDEAFSPDAPEPEFSARYYEKRRALERSIAMKKHTNKKPYGIVIAAAAAVALTPVIAAGAAKISRMYTNQTATYANDVVVEPVESETETAPVYDSAAKDVVFGWIPEDMHLTEKDADGWYPQCRVLNAEYSYDSTRGITCALYRMAPDQTYDEPYLYVTHKEQYETAAGNSVTLMESAYEDDKNAVVIFPDTNYVLEVHCFGLSTEELRQVIEQITLTDSEQDYAGAYTPYAVRNAGADMPVQEAEWANGLTYGEDINNMHPLAVGETAEYLYGMNLGVDVTLESVTVQKDFAGLTADGTGRGTDFSKFLDADGNISAVRSVIRYGDGMSTLDETVSEETVQQYVILTKLKFTNNSEQTVNDMNLNLFTFALDGDRMISPQDRLTQREPNLDVRWSDIELLADRSQFSLTADKPLSKNNLQSLAPGESAEVTFANLVDADEFGNLYLRVNAIASSVDQIMESNVIDLCSLTAADAE